MVKVELNTQDIVNVWLNIQDIVFRIRRYTTQIMMLI